MAIEFNKSLGTNLSCAAMIVIGHTLAPEAIRNQIINMGYFGFSGAITNWLAVHMLFERVPGLYGSGIIPLKFEAFKSAIREMVMNQFFNSDNIEKFIKSEEGLGLELEPLVDNLNYDLIFEGFVEVVQKSKFGGFLGMIGGVSALDSMRPIFETTLKKKLKEIVKEPGFLDKLSGQASAGVQDTWQQKIAEMVDHRLSELTPQMVKEIIQKMIRSHLGWLVVWGGVFGSLIGLLSSFAVR